MLSISPATEPEREAAFRLAFQHLSTVEIANKVRDADAMIATGGRFDLAGPR
jgi:hypothetical protein